MRGKRRSPFRLRPLSLGSFLLHLYLPGPWGMDRLSKQHDQWLQGQEGIRLPLVLPGPPVS